MADATKAAPAMQLLAAEHQGMRVDYIGLLWQCRQELEQNAPGYAEMLRQLQEHLRELGQRWYAGDTAVVDELLQLYSIEKDARQALQARMAAEARPSVEVSWPRHVTLRVFRDERRAREDFDMPRPGIVKKHATMKLITGDGHEVRYAVAPDLKAAHRYAGHIIDDLVFMEEVPADVRRYLKSLELGAERQEGVEKALTYVRGFFDGAASPAAAALSAPAQDAQAEPATSAEPSYLRERLQDFVCRRVENAGGTEGLTLYFTKLGAHPEYQLYDSEALALWINLGNALGPLAARTQPATPPAAPQASPVPFGGDEAVKPMTPGRALYFMERFKHEEKLLGPNEQAAVDFVIAMLEAAPTAPQAVPLTDHHKLDNDQQVFFYEQDFYVLSNFSSFALHWRGLDFPTSEHAYHWEKFAGVGARHAECRQLIRAARSAHDAFKLAAELKHYRRADWDAVKVGIMRDILRAKAQQHEYVRRKLLATGDRELIEDSWRDDYWGWGPNRDGQNMLGKLWMEVRAELRAGIGTTATKEQSK